MLISEILTRHDQEKICLRYKEKAFTYGELEKESTGLALKLAGQLKKGEKVFLQYQNPLKQLCAFFAVVKAGGIAVPAGEVLNTKQRAAFLKKQQIQLILNEDSVLANKEKALLPSLKKEDIFLGALSSGSTGSPKLILRDQVSWLEAFPWQSKLFHLQKKDVLYLQPALSYTANLNACLHLLFLGGEVVFAGSKMPKTWLRELEDFAATSIFFVPAHYQLLLKNCRKINEKIFSLVTGGAKIACQTVLQLQKFFPRAKIVEYYGTSELGHISYATGQELLQKKFGVGRLFPQVKVEFQEQEIFVTSPYIVPALRPKAGAGDVGYLNKEGCLVLTGRKDNLINVAGRKIALEYLEEWLESCPGIAEAVAFALPDNLKGQIIAAGVVKKQEALKAAAIKKYLYKKVRLDCLEKIYFLDQLPLNASGKVDRRFLASWLAGEHEG